MKIDIRAKTVTQSPSLEETKWTNYTLKRVQVNQFLSRYLVRGTMMDSESVSIMGK